MFVEKLSLKNFKSFRECDLRFVKGFNAIVGPNGSGKTNIVDALLFSLGESRIRSLRAKKTPDLIYKDARIAEAKLELRNEKEKERTWISRALRRDGKMKYAMNGKRSHRYVIEDFLRANQISTYNIIQQGEVQRIVEMSSKDRRALIDNIANVLEYEQKKKEALSELDHVDEKIRENSAKLGEKAGFLDQLKKDKVDAERYLGLKKEVDQMKATLLYLNLRELEVEFENSVNTVLDLTSKIEQLHRKANDLQDQIDAIQKQKDDVNKRISERSEGKQLVLEKESDELKAEMERCRTLTKEKESELERLTGKAKELKLERVRAGDEVKGIRARASDVERELKAVETLLKEEQRKLNEVLEASTQFSSQFFDARKLYEQLQQQMMSAKEHLNELQAEEKTLSEVMRLKEGELHRLLGGKWNDHKDAQASASKRLKEWTQKVREADDVASKLFAEEKRLNGALSLAESETTAAKIKTVEISTRLQNLREIQLSQGVEYVLSQKEKTPGIFGTVEQLCQYDSMYSVPVQVALGGRLNFLVVNNIHTAEKMVRQLKMRKLGRVSFIPLDRIRPHAFKPDELRLKDHPAAVDFLVHLLEFETRFQKAFQFVCQNTLLVKGLSEAATLVGKARLVTEDGELVEQSALITGGSFSARINVKKEKEQLDEWDARWKKAKQTKDDLLKRLYSIQEDMSSARKKKAEAEVQLKACELEIQNLKNSQDVEEEKFKNVRAAAAELKKEVNISQERSAKIEEERSDLIRSLSDLNIRSLEVKGKIDVEKEQKFGVSLKEKEKKVSDLRLSLSDYKNQFDSLAAQLKAYSREHDGIAKAEKELELQEGEAKRVMKECKETLSRDQKLLKEKTQELKGMSSAMEDLVSEREKLEGKVYNLANQKGKLEFEREKIAGDLQKKEVGKAVSETNLSNLKAEFEPYKDTELLKMEDKAKLTLLSYKAEEELSGLGNVNLKAVEEYEERAKDLDRQQDKIRQLSNEKQAVITMIQEIEGKKIATFMRSFNHVNESFRKLFSQIFRGEGSLVLETPSNPFEGGLTIKAQLEGKSVKYLELMSGGEKSLIAVLFLFAIQSYSPSSIYVLDEADAALDQQNSLKLAELLIQLSKTTQFIVVTHNPSVYQHAEALIGVAMTRQGSKLVEVKLNE
ncbi:chromosome segregation protein SMC [Candidatus Micrarchaeota archaeon]|nr:chromosome segregation protein SMC [Candidatus Micrarchaeota archaeon]